MKEKQKVIDFTKRNCFFDTYEVGTMLRGYDKELMSYVEIKILNIRVDIYREGTFIDYSYEVLFGSNQSSGTGFAPAYEFSKMLKRLGKI